MSNIERRLKRIEQAQQANNGEKFVDTDGVEFGLDPIAGGWTVLVQDGKPIKAWPKILWDAR